MLHNTMIQPMPEVRHQGQDDVYAMWPERDRAILATRANADKTMALGAAYLPAHLVACETENAIDAVATDRDTIDATDSAGHTALMLAASTQEAERLLQLGAAIDVQDHLGQTALMLAATANDVERTQLLLSHHANVHLRDAEGSTVLLRCAEASAEIVALLLAHGADPDAIDRDGDNTLMRAVTSQNVPVIKSLLPVTNVTHANPKNGNTLLHVAAWTGHSRRSRLLGSIAAVCNVNACNHAGETPLLYALRTAKDEQDLFETINTLLGAGASVHTPCHAGASPFLIACQRGFAAVLYVLAQARANVNHKDHTGRTGLHHAVVRGHTQSIDVLVILFDVDVNCATPTGDTPLLLASAGGNKHMVRTFLTKRRMDLAHANLNGESALHVACAGGHAAVVHELLAYASHSLHGRDKRGRTPFLTACARGHVSVLKTLLHTGAIDVHHCDHSGQSGLLLASANGHFDVVQWFLEIPTVLATVCNHMGYEAFHAAVVAGHGPVAALLFQLPLVAIEAAARALDG
ncbi:hypothetical protein SDRG_04465 [Saprolegnia diclina VS20]|uniref:Uncharacterized protein n=1 Tax=Saprolegnia diclina (strain VS20) TaxID=1156394 RepID=T0QVK5_SAPDV|nr:hypothetical protein SDRG_04465 [Saprolegnia diclina VS20]EQC38035.1 hypothetical protein SDRG_04465 [Saprolegnia diclina VS20]|eukprot:XP_008608362.1 hypothetical protein SDRG_04465 [Saprolegnia diclina VS20]